MITATPHRRTSSPLTWLAGRLVVRAVIAVLLFVGATDRILAQEPGSATGREAATSDASELNTDARIAALEAQVRELRDALTSSPMRSVPATAPPSTTYPNIRLNGLLQLDAGTVDQNPANIAQYGDIDSVLGFRRARIGTDGNFTDDLYYRLVVDFATSGRPSFRDAFIEYRGLDEIGIIRVGEWRQPFGLDSQTPNTSLLFMERALPHAFAPHRETGIGIRNRNADETMTWHASFFGLPSDSWANVVGDGSFGLATRVTAIVWEDSSRNALFHIGGDYSYQHPGDSGLRFRSPPEFLGVLTGTNGNTSSMPNFVDTGVLSGASANAFDLELLAVHGPFSSQAELVWTTIDSTTIDQAICRGATIQAGYVLTGESHVYNREFAYLERLKPDCPVGDGGIGAWELGARLSALDLDAGRSRVAGSST